MTTTIAQQVSQLVETMAAQPANEVMDAFSREQAELAASGVTVNVYRRGSVNTAMQGWIRSQPPDEIGAALHEHFQASYEQGSLITPEHSARSLLTQLVGDETGEIWTVTDA